ncbi:unnamed protein product [marine sediment metagenome]|uniref:Uncharacterized protein n=1 Tax=marine sediment metagenome TaxID=412755 RepID=X1JC09_9ZZZZ
MTNSIENDDFRRRTIRIHKTLDKKIDEYKKEELLSTWTQAATDLIKKGFEKVKEEQKKW